MNKYWRSDFCYNLAKFVGGKPISKKFNFSSPKYKIEPPFVVLSNHTTDNDAMFIASSFSVPIHFVMSDHICSKPFGKAITKMIGAIPITKSTKDTTCIKQIFNVAQNGGAIGIFPEGNKSYAGKMSYIKPSIAKLVKKLNVPVVLYTINGGYFSAPRWSTCKRRGQICGKIEKIISKDELNQKNATEIYDIISNTLAVDAYKEQESSMQHYKGKNLCNNIESILYYCPHCHKYDTLYGYKNYIRCNNCDLVVEMDDCGYLSFGPYSRLDEWDDAQKKELLNKNFDIDEIIFVDEDCLLKKKKDYYHNQKIGKYLMSLQHKKLIFVPRSPKYEFISIPIENIQNYALEGINGLQLCMKNGDVYRIHNKKSTNAIKYIDAICAINNFRAR